ncbi:hypothetical protein [Ahrensia kielensis]|uniref:hypothetical protein n=1 Tax=Ahrensia kielensis TaxID=76980 RepID=UPI00036FB569|nr:hypothetical protein [Ahrensia kielensis]
MTANKKAETVTKDEKKKGGLGPLLHKVFSVSSVLSATVLFAATFDVGHMGLAPMLGSLTAIPVATFAIFSIAAIFTMPKAGASASIGNSEDAIAAFTQFQSKTASRFASLENTIDMMSGNDKESLIEENKKLKAELDAIHQAERDKVDSEVEELRKHNEQLEEEIKQWARKAVENAVNGQAQAA